MEGKQENHFSISEEEYLKAQAIINEYHRERQQQADHELEEDDMDNWEDDEDAIEQQFGDYRTEAAMNCTCGAWGFSKTGVVVHVSDCICGAD